MTSTISSFLLTLLLLTHYNCNNETNPSKVLLVTATRTGATRRAAGGGGKFKHVKERMITTTHTKDKAMMNYSSLKYNKLNDDCACMTLSFLFILLHLLKNELLLFVNLIVDLICRVFSIVLLIDKNWEESVSKISPS